MLRSLCGAAGRGQTKPSLARHNSVFSLSQAAKKSKGKSCLLELPKSNHFLLFLTIIKQQLKTAFFR